MCMGVVKPSSSPTLLSAIATGSINHLCPPPLRDLSLILKNLYLVATILVAGGCEPSSLLPAAAPTPAPVPLATSSLPLYRLLGRHPWKLIYPRVNLKHLCRLSLETSSSSLSLPLCARGVAASCTIDSPPSWREPPTTAAESVSIRREEKADHHHAASY